MTDRWADKQKKKQKKKKTKIMGGGGGAFARLPPPPPWHRHCFKNTCMIFSCIDQISKGVSGKFAFNKSSIFRIIYTDCIQNNGTSRIFFF